MDEQIINTSTPKQLRIGAVLFALPVGRMLTIRMVAPARTG
ncbi:MAG TPA: hypothetical protein VIJ27_02630 [Mucilaginibacter sp.]